MDDTLAGRYEPFTDYLAAAISRHLILAGHEPGSGVARPVAPAIRPVVRGTRPHRSRSNSAPTPDRAIGRPASTSACHIVTCVAVNTGFPSRRSSPATRSAVCNAVSGTRTAPASGLSPRPTRSTLVAGTRDSSAKPAACFRAPSRPHRKLQLVQAYDSTCGSNSANSAAATASRSGSPSSRTAFNFSRAPMSARSETVSPHST